MTPRGEPDPRQLRMEALQAMSEAARRADSAPRPPPRGPRPPLRRVHGDVSTAPHIHGAYIPPPPAEAAEQPPRFLSVCSGHSDGYYIANSIPIFSQLNGLIGAVLSPFLSFVIPVTLLFKSGLKPTKLDVVCSVVYVLAVGGYAFGAGTYAAKRNILTRRETTLIGGETKRSVVFFLFLSSFLEI